MTDTDTFTVFTLPDNLSFYIEDFPHLLIKKENCCVGVKCMVLTGQYKGEFVTLPGNMKVYKENYVH